MDQGRVAGANMAGADSAYDGTIVTNSLKVAGIALTAFGELDVEGRHTAMLCQDPGKGVYRKLVHDQGRILGGMFLGDEQGAKAALAAMRQDQSINADLRALFD